MNVNSFFPLAAFLLTLPFLDCLSAPAPNRSTPVYANRPVSEDNGAAIRQIRTVLSDLRHEINNHETEIRIFENNLRNQETTWDCLREELTEDIRAQKDYSRVATINVEGKIDSLDKRMDNLDGLIKGLVSDFKQLKGQANDSVQVLSEYRQRLTELEKTIDAQNQHMNALQNGLQSIVDLLQAKELAEKSMALNKPTDDKTHKVQSGDSLEKIARAYDVSVQALRENNRLTNDRIIIGQSLKIPEKNVSLKKQ